MRTHDDGSTSPFDMSGREMAEKLSDFAREAEAAMDAGVDPFDLAPVAPLMPDVKGEDVTAISASGRLIKRYARDGFHVILAMGPSGDIVRAHALSWVPVGASMQDVIREAAKIGTGEHRYILGVHDAEDAKRVPYQGDELAALGLDGVPSLGAGRPFTVRATLVDIQGITLDGERVMSARHGMSFNL